jgi:hydroxypyruvate reductase
VNSTDTRELLRRMFDAAIAAAQPALCVPRHLPAAPKGRLVVIGSGKASAAMARAVEDHWHGPLSGLVVTRYGYAVPCQRIEIVEAAHPVPDAAGEAAARRLLQFVQGLTEDDLVLCLMSGGGSSLLPLALPGLTLADKQVLNRALLASGASITEMNCVRRHLSAIKGGRLAAACAPARVVNLLLSDVPGDDPIDIASGPTVADPSTCADANGTSCDAARSRCHHVRWDCCKAAKARRCNPATRACQASRRTSSPRRRGRSKPPPRSHDPPAARPTSSATPSKAKRAI